MSNRQISKTTQILIEAKGLIEDERNWCQGHNILEHPGGRTQYCAFGAAMAVIIRFRGFSLLQKVLPAQILYETAVEMGWDGIEELNDLCNHATVMSLFDQAITRSMQAETPKE